jgi:hypothetical protein
MNYSDCGPGIFKLTVGNSDMGLLSTVQFSGDICWILHVGDSTIATLAGRPVAL